MPATRNSRLMSVADVCAEYGYSERQVKRWIVGRKFRVHKPSGKTGPAFLFRDDIEAFISETTQEPNR
jgi:hypothetical protein